MRKIAAVDRLTVEFQLCAPDVAFLPKAAFSTFGIQDADYLAAHAPDKSYLTAPNGTGPYKLPHWDTRNRIDLEAYDGTSAGARWSGARPRRRRRPSSAGATPRPSGSSSSSQARSTGWTTPVATRTRRSKRARPCSSWPARR